MIITKIALTAAIMGVVAAFAIVATEEDMRFKNWDKLSRVDKVLLVLTGGIAVAVLIGVLAFIWGV